jgi:hypothetical protein
LNCETSTVFAASHSLIALFASGCEQRLAPPSARPLNTCCASALTFARRDSSGSRHLGLL